MIRALAFLGAVAIATPAYPAAQCYILHSDFSYTANWYNCAHRAAAMFTDQAESAAVVAEAALASCGHERTVFIDGLGGLICDSAIAAADDAEADIRRYLLKNILTARAAARLKQAPRQTPHPAIDYKRM